MKTIIKITLLLFICSVSVFSQKTEHNFFDGNKTIKDVFSEVYKNNDGQLCVKMKSSGLRYLISINGKTKPFISNYNEVYCIKDSIKFSQKGGWQLTIVNDKKKHWVIRESEVNLSNGTRTKRKGGFKIKKDTIIEPD